MEDIRMFMLILSIFFCVLIFSGIIYIINCKNKDNKKLGKSIFDILIMITILSFMALDADIISSSILSISCLFYYAIIWGKLYEDKRRRNKSDIVFAAILNILIVTLYGVCTFQ